VVERGMNDETHGAERWIVEQSSEVAKRNAAARRVIDVTRGAGGWAVHPSNNETSETKRNAAARKVNDVTRGADGWAVHPSNNERSVTKHNAAHETRGHGTRDAAGWNVLDARLGVSVGA
jgi:hypothetical protein